MGTITSMRRVVLVIVLALVVGGVAWVLWPATTWPRSFCVPVVRVVGTDATAIMTDVEHNGWQRPVASTPGASAMVARLRADIVLARAIAPTSQLRVELGDYLSALRDGHSMLPVSDAISQFDQEARTQLEACAVKPVGS